MANKDVSTTLLGFSRIEQVDENVKALELYKIWNKDIEASIEKVLGNSPAADMNSITFRPYPSRRQ